MKKDRPGFTLAHVVAHAAKHGLPLPDGVLLNADNAARIAGASVQTAPLRQGRQPNKTEQRFLDILEARKRRGEIDSVRYEGVTLKWGVDEKTGQAMRYTPDAVVGADGKWTMMEVKGAHIRNRDLVRFKGCRAEWPEFHFEMHQWKQGEWRRIH